MIAPGLIRLERLLAGGGMVTAAAALLLLLINPRGALTGWLAAATTIAALPAGALILQLTMRLVAGRWTEDLSGPARLLGVLWPLAGVALLPVLTGMGVIFPWFGAAPHSAFAGIWLAPPLFAARTIGWCVFGWYAAQRAAGGLSEGAAAGLQIVAVLWTNFSFTDWLMTLDPAFASSGFGLQAISFATSAALALMILLRMAAGRPRYPGVLGGLLLTLLLLWAYFQFMPFLIAWSGNLPDKVAWYVARSDTGWVAASALAGALGGIPLIALLTPQVRTSARRVALCAGAVLAGKAIEFAWLALPGRGSFAVLAWLLALVGLSCIGLATLLRAARRGTAT